MISTVVTLLKNSFVTGRMYVFLLRDATLVCKLRKLSLELVLQLYILGLILEQGTLRANPHRIDALSTCEAPVTAIDDMNVLSRVIPGCSSLLAPLDSTIAGMDSSETFRGCDMLKLFAKAQKAIFNKKTMNLPHRDDIFWIVTDGAVRHPRIRTTLYISRDDQLLHAGFFSAKLRG